MNIIIIIIINIVGSSSSSSSRSSRGFLEEKLEKLIIGSMISKLVARMMFSKVQFDVILSFFFVFVCLFLLF